MGYNLLHNKKFKHFCNENFLQVYFSIKIHHASSTVAKRSNSRSTINFLGRQSARACPSARASRILTLRQSLCSTLLVHFLFPSFYCEKIHGHFSPMTSAAAMAAAAVSRFAVRWRSECLHSGHTPRSLSADESSLRTQHTGVPPLAPERRFSLSLARCASTPGRKFYRFSRRNKHNRAAGASFACRVRKQATRINKIQRASLSLIAIYELHIYAPLKVVAAAAAAAAFLCSIRFSFASSSGGGEKASVLLSRFVLGERRCCCRRRHRRNLWLCCIHNLFSN